MCLPPCRGWLGTDCSPAGVHCRGVARKRREHDRLESGVPASVSSPRERHMAMFIMIGIDPHTASHTAVAIDGNEHLLDETRMRTSATQADQLRGWADRFENRTVGGRVRAGPRLSACPAARRCGRGRARRARGAGIADPHIEFGPVTERRPQRCPIGRDCGATRRRPRTGPCR